MWRKTEDILLKEKPELVIVYGDTNSTLAGALAATKIHIKTAHIEAGYRSYDRNMPEEVNRVITDQVSNLLFAPTKRVLKTYKKKELWGKFT
jgi:UDP-N-acetylglucosamine 2-epimerase (non-hydrolysing)